MPKLSRRRRMYLTVYAISVVILLLAAIIVVAAPDEERVSSLFAGLPAGAAAFVGLLTIHATHGRTKLSAGRTALRPSRTVRCVSRLLPAEVRDGHQEEWSAWLLDLRERGTPRVQRWIELLTIVLIAAPRLAIALRQAAYRAVDRSG